MTIENEKCFDLTVLFSVFATDESGVMRESPVRQCRSEADTSLEEVFVEVSTESAHSAPSPAAGGIISDKRQDCRGRSGRKYLAPPPQSDGDERKHHQSVVAFDERQVATAPTTPTVLTSSNIVKSIVRKFSQRVGSNKRQGE